MVWDYVDKIKASGTKVQSENRFECTSDPQHIYLKHINIME